MADDAQDLEIENILSSIKGILEEDEGNSKNEPLSPSIENESNVVDDVLSQDMDDDVLELSQDMRIEHQEGDPEQAVEEIIVPDITPQDDITTESVTEEDAEPVVEEISEPEVTTPQEEMVAEPVIEETTEQVVEEVVETDGAVDASANIISNFAKMFSKNKDEQSEPKQQVTGLGNANHTLEDFVKEAIIKVIGDDIARQWNDGADYRTMAEAEIKKQVQVWVNDNMPKMVEKIVKDEMERVIAKVGS